MTRDWHFPESSGTTFICSLTEGSAASAGSASFHQLWFSNLTEAHSCPSWKVCLFFFPIREKNYPVHHHLCSAQAKDKKIIKQLWGKVKLQSKLLPFRIEQKLKLGGLTLSGPPNLSITLLSRMGQEGIGWRGEKELLVVPVMSVST